MRRREFIAGLGGAAAWPMVAQAQHPAMPVIGFLSSGRSDDFNDVVATFRKGLAETSHRRTKTGDVSSSRNYGTNIFVKHEGRWLMAFHQSALIP
jgi:hypothetical protein